MFAVPACKMIVLRVLLASPSLVFIVCHGCYYFCEVCLLLHFWSVITFPISYYQNAYCYLYEDYA